ncbi:MAG: hypothetical protein ACI857_000715 [Arenicella sp.]|jgi:hypothetical protein
MLHINKFLFVFLFCATYSVGYGQRDSVKYVKSPYRAESTPNFVFKQFKRGFSNSVLKLKLDSLENKPRKEWSRLDSLKFAEASLQTGNRDLSKFYFQNLNVDFQDEEDYWYDQLMIDYLNEDYVRALAKIKKSSPMILEFSKIYFLKKMILGKVKNKADEKWHKDNKVLNWEVDSSLNELEKDDPLFIQSVIRPLKNLEYVLDQMISYVYEDDPILANACREMAALIKGHLSLSQAYIGYSLGRHYNKWDKDLLADLKDVKAQMTQKKYKIPNFRKYFPRIEYWRFDYQMLKEEIILEKNDSSDYIIPKNMNKKPEPRFTFPHQLIVVIGILLFFILIVVFVKTRKK